MPTNASGYEERFAELLRQIRLDSGLSQTDVAEMATELGLPGMHQQTIQKIESKKRPIRLNEAEVLARVVGLKDPRLGLIPFSPAELREQIAEVEQAIDENDRYLRIDEAELAKAQEVLREAERTLAKTKAW